jgi:hypothetical protein
MARAAAAAGFSVEILVKKHEVAPMRIVHVFRDLAVARARPILVGQKDAPQPARQFPRYFLKRSHISGTRRALDFERLTVKEVITFERFDDQEIDREPNWAAPVRVAAEKITVSLARNVIDSVFFAAHVEDVRLVPMNA